MRRLRVARRGRLRAVRVGLPGVPRRRRVHDRARRAREEGRRRAGRAMSRILARARAPRRGPARGAAAPSPRAGAPERFMRLALREAAKGLGRTSPNPAVGAVLVRGRARRRARAPRARRRAARRGGRDPRRRRRARAAPTSTRRSSPAITTARRRPARWRSSTAGVRRVFVGSADPNPLVNGKGIARLRGAGVEVAEGVLRDGVRRAERPLVQVHQRAAAVRDPQGGGDARRPDRHAHRRRALGDGRGRAPLGPPAARPRGRGARRRRHRARRRPAASRRGSRAAAGATRSGSCSTPTSASRPASRSSARARPRRRSSRTPRARTRRVRPGVELLRCKRGKGGVDLRDLLAKLAARGVTHLLVEGGARVHARFLEAGLVDRVAVLVAPKLAGADGVPLVAGRGPGPDGGRAPARRGPGRADRRGRPRHRPAGPPGRAAAGARRRRAR